MNSMDFAVCVPMVIPDFDARKISTIAPSTLAWTVEPAWIVWMISSADASLDLWDPCARRTWMIVWPCPVPMEAPATTWSTTSCARAHLDLAARTAASTSTSVLADHAKMEDTATILSTTTNAPAWKDIGAKIASSQKATMDYHILRILRV